MSDNTPAAQLATVDDISLHVELAALRENYANAMRRGAGLAEGLRQARAELAAKDERIAVLQRSWDKARDGNTAWLDGGVVALPADAAGQIAARVHDVLCDCHGNHTGITLRTMDLDKIRVGIRPLIESWRPATEPAEATVQQQLAVTLPEMLAEFHAGFGQSWGDGGSGSNELRARLHEEENAELIEALQGGNQVEIAHELADVVYVAYGTAHSLGIPLDDVIAEVHRANMSKTDGNGRFVLRADGKVLKTDRYRTPDVAGVLRRATESAEATKAEVTGERKWWRVTCCEAGQVAYPTPCPWHGTDGHPATPATERAKATGAEATPPRPYESCVLDGAGHCSRGSHTHDGGDTDE